MSPRDDRFDPSDIVAPVPGLTRDLTAAEPELPDPARVRIILVGICVALLFASLGQTIVSTAMPVMVADLGGMQHITWVMTAFLLASTVGAPISGKLGDLFGRKIVVQVAMLIFVLGSVICGLAGNMGTMILGRVIQGAGGGSLIVTSMTIVGDILPARERGRAQAVLGAMFGVSTVIGPLVGGFLVENFSWHWIFFVNLPVGVLAFAVLTLALPKRTDRSRKSLDFAGAALLITFLATAVLISNLGGSVLPWLSAGMAAMLALAALSLLGFVHVERRAAEPILPLQLFSDNTFVVVNLVGFLVGAAMFGTITFLPLFLQVVKGVSPTASGLFLVPMMTGLVLSSAGAGRIMARTGRYKRLPMLSTGLLAVAMVSLGFLTAQTPLWSIALSMVCVGLGLGPVFSVGVAAIQNAVPRSMMGVGTASTNMFRLTGGSMGTAAFGALFSAGLARELAGRLPAAQSDLSALGAEAVQAMSPPMQLLVTDGFSQALHPIFWIAACAAVVACFASTRLRELPLAAR